MKVLFVSTHTDQQTGYAKVAFNLLKELSSLPIQLFHFGFQRHTAFRREKLPIKQYDAQANEEPKEQGFGFNVFNEYLDLVNPDIIIIYNDTLVINKFLSLIPETKAKIYIYLDQVYKYTALGDIPKRADKLFVFSPNWKVPLPTDSKTTIHILPHAPDSSVKSLSKDEITKQKELLNLQNKTIFLNINRNSNRKRLDLTLQAFKLYHHENPDSHLILVTTESGFYNIQTIVAIEEIPTSSLTFINTEKTPLTDAHINLLYNIADYGINTADGEGFGLSTLEHASLGNPQLTLNIGAFPDYLTHTDSALITPSLRTYIHNQGVGVYSESATPEEISKGMSTLSTKSSPKITVTWESITKELKSFLAPDTQTISLPTINE
jgi:glycosyltransferase involved in cell wall biosynthesis